MGKVDPREPQLSAIMCCGKADHREPSATFKPRGPASRSGSVLLLIAVCCTSSAWAAGRNAAAWEYHVTFEEGPAEVFVASTGSRFDQIKAETANMFRPNHDLPAVDSTTGTPQGSYVVATGSQDKGDNYRVLYTPCLQPTGPECALHFNYWHGGNTTQVPDMVLHALSFCHTCSTGANGRSFMVHEVTANEVGQWAMYTWKIGASPSMWVLGFFVDLPNQHSVVAIDDIFLKDCHIDPQEGVCGSDEFQCPYTTLCISKLKVCDFVDDCFCGEDESKDRCEVIPEQGRVNFRDCDFEAGLCFWYNVKSRDPRALPWKLRTTADHEARPNVNLPYHTSTKWSYVYASPDESSQPRWASAHLRSVDFPAPPAADGACVVRFSYWLSGNPNLTIQLMELGGTQVRTLWTSENQAGTSTWATAMASVNDHPISQSGYVLQATAQTMSSQMKHAVALTNISLSLECFLHNDVLVHFTTCGSRGRAGPTQAMCDDAYGARGDVTVASSPPFQGGQEWTVPISAKYSLRVFGARGGRDKEETDSELTYGTHVHAKFHLDSGDKLLVVVGQSGEDSSQALYRTAIDTYNNTYGGGGGGGATWVYVKRNSSSTKKPELLVMAGGGAGMDYLSFTQNDSVLAEEPPWSLALDDTSGSGPEVAWTNVTDFTGRLCQESSSHHSILGYGSTTTTIRGSDSYASGGFGLGSGACSVRGGNGGGAATGSGDNSTARSAGQPGGVYVHPRHLLASSTLMSHGGDGAVMIHMPNWRCPCDFLCKWHRPELLNTPKAGAFSCLCPPGRKLAKDGLSCVANISSSAGHDPPETIYSGFTTEKAGTTVIVIIAVFVSFIIIVAVFFLYVMRSGPQDRLWSIKLVLTRCLRNRSQSLPLQPLASLPARVTHVNPNYSFLANQLSDRTLPEVARDTLRLSTLLGHGAFGEVYKGFLSGAEKEVAVAIKALPPLCSEQTELDFFMEAFIVSKFHHPNIVKFVGVCFDQQPRYIVLELLEGGNVKSFLKDNRPSQGSKSKLSVGDLVALAKDVCCGCCYLEQHHFIHRDIAARNCLLTSRGPDRVAKIADFGMSRDVYRADYYRKEGRALLPLKWMPPEAFIEGVFTSKTDVWSFGVLLWEIFTMGYMPYPALSNTEIMNFIYIGGRLDCPDGCPPSVYNLMLSCWRHKAEERPSFAFIMLTIESILQDTATMSQRLPAFRLPHLINGCSSRNLKLLNHPVPNLGFHLDTVTAGSEPLCTEPLLKTRDSHLSGQRDSSGGGHGSTVSGRKERFSKRTVSLDSDSTSSRGSCSSLEPLLPHGSQSQSQHLPLLLVHSYDNAASAADLDRPWGRSPSPEGEPAMRVRKEKEEEEDWGREGEHQAVRLPPAVVIHRGNEQRLKLVTAVSLGTLEEKDETSATCEDNSNQNYSSV